MMGGLYCQCQTTFRFRGGRTKLPLHSHPSLPTNRGGRTTFLLSGEGGLLFFFRGKLHFFLSGRTTIRENFYCQGRTYYCPGELFFFFQGRENHFSTVNASGEGTLLSMLQGRENYFPHKNKKCRFWSLKIIANERGTRGGPTPIHTGEKISTSDSFDVPPVAVPRVAPEVMVRTETRNRTAEACFLEEINCPSFSR